MYQRWDDCNIWNSKNMIGTVSISNTRNDFSNQKGSISEKLVSCFILYEPIVGI